MPASPPTETNSRPATKPNYYYTEFIKSHSDWEFIEVYADEGVTGTSMKRREGFKRMIDNALNGKISLIVTKSVSRFARNTVDSLTTIRKLKEHSVEVYFEKENVWAFDSKGEPAQSILIQFRKYAHIAKPQEIRASKQKLPFCHQSIFPIGQANL